MNSVIRSIAEERRRRLVVGQLLTEQRDNDTLKTKEARKQEVSDTSSSNPGSSTSAAPLPPSRSQQLALASLHRLHPTATFLATRGRGRGRGGAGGPARRWSKYLPGRGEPREQAGADTAAIDQHESPKTQVQGDVGGEPGTSEHSTRDSVVAPLSQDPQLQAPSAPAQAATTDLPQPQSDASDPEQEADLAAELAKVLRQLNQTADDIQRIRPLLNPPADSGSSTPVNTGNSAAAAASGRTGVSTSAPVPPDSDDEEKQLRDIYQLLGRCYDRLDRMDPLVLLKASAQHDERRVTEVLTKAQQHHTRIGYTLVQHSALTNTMDDVLFKEAPALSVVYAWSVWNKSRHEDERRQGGAAAEVRHAAGGGLSTCSTADAIVMVRELAAHISPRYRMQWLRLLGTLVRQRFNTELVAGRAMCGLMLYWMANEWRHPLDLEPLTCAAMCACYVTLQRSSSFPISPIHLYDNLAAGPLVLDPFLPPEEPPPKLSRKHLLNAVEMFTVRPDVCDMWSELVWDWHHRQPSQRMDMCLRLALAQCSDGLTLQQERLRHQQERHQRAQGEPAGAPSRPASMQPSTGQQADAGRGRVQGQQPGAGQALGSSADVLKGDGLSDLGMRRLESLLQALLRLQALQPRSSEPPSASAVDHPHLNIDAMSSRSAPALMACMEACSMKDLVFQLEFSDQGTASGEASAAAQPASSASSAAAAVASVQANYTDAALHGKSVLKMVVHHSATIPKNRPPGYKWSQITSSIVTMNATSNFPQQVKLVREALVKRRLRFMWLQGRGVEGIWRALVTIAQIRQEMLQTGRDLCACHCDVIDFGDGDRRGRNDVKSYKYTPKELSMGADVIKLETLISNDLLKQTAG
ncbi:hypothetical protein Agub_g1548, partial [Astrephomene gubernaculifera]